MGNMTTLDCDRSNVNLRRQKFMLLVSGAFALSFLLPSYLFQGNKDSVSSGNLFSQRFIYLIIKDIKI